MLFPTPYTVQWCAFVAGAEDSYGNPVDAWADPVDVKVHGWAPPSADGVAIEQGRAPIERDKDLYVPPGTASGPRDHWILPGEPATDCPTHPDVACFEQVGYADDFTKGPFGYTAGLRINLLRVVG